MRFVLGLTIIGAAAFQEMDAAAPKDPSKLSAEEKKKADDQQKILVQKNNAAVDELQAVVGHFNEQLKIFKAKQQKQ